MKNTADQSFLNQTNASDRDNTNWFGRAGATWHLTPNDDLRVGLMGMIGKGDNSQAIHYLSGDALGDTIYTSDRLSDGNSKMRMYNIELGYLHEFSENSNIDFTFTHNRFWNEVFVRNRCYPAKGFDGQIESKNILRYAIRHRNVKNI